MWWDPPDLGGERARWMTVGVLSWAVPEGSPLKEVDIDEDAPK